MLDYLEIGVRFMLGGWIGAPIWEKKHTAEYCIHVVSADFWVKTASVHSLVRSRFWFSQSNWGGAGCGLICASSVSSGLCGSSYHHLLWCMSLCHSASAVSRLDWIKKLPKFLLFHWVILNLHYFLSSFPKTAMAVQEQPGGWRHENTSPAILKLKSGKALYSLCS